MDSTDSLRGGCTTHVAALLAELVLELGGEFRDFPHLVRLNPNIPFKTRGNGAASLNFKLDESLQPSLLAAAEEVVTREADLAHHNSDPGLVLMQDIAPPELQSFADRCLHDVVTLDEAEVLIEKYAVYAHRWKQGRGLIGALAAVGLNLPTDYIFEFIAYRHHQNYGKPRRVDPACVRKMNEVTSPNTLNNIDDESGRILITPRGPDPVLLGIRGESPEVLLTAFNMLAISEQVERWIIFRSNECTDSHLQPVAAIAQLEPHAAAIVHGTILTKPRIIRGGHVFMDMADGTGVISLAAYEPTGSFRKVMVGFVPGDQVIAAGGVRPSPHAKGLTLNLESITATMLVRSLEGNPLCPSCKRKMESMGRGKGYRCRKCGHHSEGLMKAIYPLERNLADGDRYQPPPRAHRHLTRPNSRRTFVKDANPPFFPEWCSFYSPPIKIRWRSS